VDTFRASLTAKSLDVRQITEKVTMIQIHTSPNAVEIRNLKNVLEAEGIKCEIRGEFRKVAVGELPVNECWVELWLLDASAEEHARRIIADATASSLPAWKCPGCGEVIEGQFARCWNCQTERSANGTDT
jgi:hypothetical protein